jgi:hypothetical protein
MVDPAMEGLYLAKFIDWFTDRFTLNLCFVFLLIIYSLADAKTAWAVSLPMLKIVQ